MRFFQPKIIAITVLLLLSVYVLLYIPPSSPYVVIAEIILFSLLILYATSLRAPKPYPLILSLGTGLFFLLNYLVGFQIINTLLLISGIIGIIALARHRHE